MVDGAFRILRALPEAGTDRQVSRLAELTGLPRPTVYRLLDQLRDAGAVDLADGRWTLSAGLVRIARHVEPFAGLRRPASQVLRVLRRETGATVSLIVPSDGAFVVLESVLGGEPVPDTRPGATMPAFTAAGVLLGSAPSSGPGVLVDHGAEMNGLTCYAVPLTLPGGVRAALQIGSVAEPAERFAAPLHHAAVALTRHVTGNG